VGPPWVGGGEGAAFGFGWPEPAVMRLLRPVQAGWRRLHEAWTRNEGKPKEEWGPGLDLKEAVLTFALILVVAAMALSLIASAF
jgi:hypothetical protein